MITYPWMMSLLSRMLAGTHILQPEQVFSNVSIRASTVWRQVMRGLSYFGAALLICFSCVISMSAAAENLLVPFGDHGPLPVHPTGFTAIAAGGAHSVVLKTGGKVMAWGDDRYNQCVVPWSASLPHELSGVSAIAAGLNHTVVVKDGVVMAWGINDRGQTTVPAGLVNVIAVAASDNHSVALTRDGIVVAWGNNDFGQCTIPSGLSGVISIAAGFRHTVALKNDGKVIVWGDTTDGLISVPINLRPVIAIAAGNYHTAVLQNDGTVVSWGWANTLSNVTVVPAGLSHVVALAAGGNQTLALKADGTVAAWGDIVGEPNGLTGVTAIAAGSRHALALRGNGTVVAWGNNDYGQNNIPYDMSNVVAIGGSCSQYIVLKSDGTVMDRGKLTYEKSLLPAGLRNVTAIATGDYHYMALKSDGTVAAWGNSPYGYVPAGLANVVAITAGRSHNVALKSDGTVVAWGSTQDRASIVPNGLSGVIAISAGSEHTVALKADGTVVAWGSNLYGQSRIPSGLTNVIAIAAGYYHTMALKSDGTVIAWGYSNSGPALVPSGLSGVTAIAAGFGHSVALKSDGTVVAWGRDDDGEIAIPADLRGVKSIFVDMASSWSFVSARPANAVTITNRTTVFNGQAKTVTITTRNGRAPTEVTYNGLFTPPSAAGSYIVRAIADYQDSYGSAEGTLVILPEDTAVPSTPSQVVATAQSSSSILIAWPASSDNTSVSSYLIYKNGILTGSSSSTCFIAHGLETNTTYHFTVLSQDEVGNRSALSDVATATTLMPIVGGLPVAVGDLGRMPASLHGIIAVAAGSDHTVALKSDGTVVAWGYNANGQCSVPTGLSNITAISAGGAHTLALTSNHTVVAWGRNNVGQSTIPSGLTNITAIAAGGLHSVALKNDGTVIAWGSNSSGQTTVPAGLSNVIAIAAGNNHSVALKSDGSLVAWGDNASGQTSAPPLGSIIAIAAGYDHTVALRSNGTVVVWGSRSQTSVPNGLSNVVAIAAGIYCTLALKADGTAVGWGSSASSQTDVPESLTHITAIATGGKHSVVLKDDGTVVAWGYNGYGRTTVPAELHDVVSIASHSDNALALKADGTVVAWGNDDRGQTQVPDDLDNVIRIALGTYHMAALKSDGTIATWGWDGYGLTTVPSGLNDVIDLATGGLHTVALKGDGTVVAWGFNGYGQTTIPTGLSNVKAVAAGYRHSVALTNDGTVVAWGYNSDGQTNVPSGLNNVVAIAAGDMFTMALKSDGTVVAWGKNNSGQINIPAGLNQVVAIAAGFEHAVARKSDGTIVAWSKNNAKQCTIPNGLGNVISFAAGEEQTWAIATSRPMNSVSITNRTVEFDGLPKSTTIVTANGRTPTTTTYNGSYTLPSAVGTYTVCAEADYLDSYGSATGTLTISEHTFAVPDITWPTPTSIVYGTALSDQQLNAAANVPGSFTYDPSIGITLAIGTHILSTTFIPHDSANYTSATFSTTLVVTAPPREEALVEETFNYTGTSIAAKNEGKGWSNGWTIISAKSAPYNVSLDAAPFLDYPVMTESGAHLRWWTATGSTTPQAITRSFSTPISDNSNTYWIAFQMQESAQKIRAGLWLNGYSTTSLISMYSGVVGAPSYYLLNDTATGVSPDLLVANSSAAQLFLFKIQLSGLSTEADDVVTAYVNPNLSTGPQSWTAKASRTINLNGGMKGITLKSNNNSNVNSVANFDEFRIATTWQSAVGLNGTSAPDTQAPSTPTGISATAQSSSSILITWNAANDNVGVSNYAVYNETMLVGSPITTNLTVTGLNPSASYNFTVKAIDAAGNTSPSSAVATATTNSIETMSAIAVNFQLSATFPVPNFPSYWVDAGQIYGSRIFPGGIATRNFGWNKNHTDMTRNRNKNADERLDTLCHFHAGGVWEMELPNGQYDVLVSIGDTDASSTNSIRVEGVDIWTTRGLAAGSFLSATTRVTITDGRLTVDNGAAGDKTTKINYVIIMPVIPSGITQFNPMRGDQQTFASWYKINN